MTLPDGYAWKCLALVARYLGIPLDIDQLKHEFGGGADLALNLDRGGRALGLKASLSTVSLNRIARLPMPCLLELTDGQWVAIARASGGKLLVQAGDSEAPGGTQH